MLRLRRRQRLRRKEALTLIQTIKQELGVEIAGPDEPLELAEADSWRLILVKGKAVGFLAGDRPFLTVRGLLTYKPAIRFVTVDMGAVKFVANGADVMAPGIVDADTSINVGDFVWIRDERNKQPLAVGEALLSGKDMIAAESGKAVRSIHFVGDKLWNLESEEPKKPEAHEESSPQEED